MTCTVSFSAGACDAGLLLLGPDPVVRLFRCVSPPVPLRLVRRCSPPSPCSWLDVPLVAFTPMRFLFWRRSVRLQFPRADFPVEHAEYPVSERKNTPPRRGRGARAERADDRWRNYEREKRETHWAPPVFFAADFFVRCCRGGWDLDGAESVSLSRNQSKEIKQSFFVETKCMPRADFFLLHRHCGCVRKAIDPSTSGSVFVNLFLYISIIFNYVHA